MDDLQESLAALVEAGVAAGDAPEHIYAAIRRECGLDAVVVDATVARPHLSETWFCCAEPTEAQLAPVTPPASVR
jgi:hypothetical protein